MSYLLMNLGCVLGTMGHQVSRCAVANADERATGAQSSGVSIGEKGLLCTQMAWASMEAPLPVSKGDQAVEELCLPGHESEH